MLGLLVSVLCGIFLEKRLHAVLGGLLANAILAFSTLPRRREAADILDISEPNMVLITVSAGIVGGLVAFIAHFIVSLVKKKRNKNAEDDAA